MAAMLYSFARVSAVLKVKLDDYYHNGARRWLRLHEKGGKEHEMPVHHLLEETLNEYIAAAGLRRALNRYNAWAAIRKRPRNADETFIQERYENIRRALVEAVQSVHVPYDKVPQETLLQITAVP